MNYSFNPAQINDLNLNQMRFELGDCLTLEPEKNCYLTDEEILAVLDTDLSWRRKKLRLVESLLMRFAYEVNQEVREAKWELSERFKHFEALRKKLAAEIEAEEICAAFGFSSSKSRPPVFALGMHDWR